MNTISTTLDRHLDAEAHLVRAIATAASTINSSALDSALARLELAARACHARLGLAMGTLRNTVSEISETMEALAAGIIGDLSTEAPRPPRGHRPGHRGADRAAERGRACPLCPKLLRCVGPEQVAQIDLRPSVEVTGAR
jgi:hypothetical protein